MAANPFTLLLTFDGSLTGRDRSGPVALTGGGDLSFVPDYAPGRQAARLAEGSGGTGGGNVAFTTTMPFMFFDQGSIAVRFRVDAITHSLTDQHFLTVLNDGVFEEYLDFVVGLGNLDNPDVSGWLEANSFFGSPGTHKAETAVGSIQEGIWYTSFMVWTDGGVVGARVSATQTLISESRAGHNPALVGSEGFVSSETMEGTIVVSQIAVSDRPLTTTERQVLADTDTWYWTTLSGVPHGTFGAGVFGAGYFGVSHISQPPGIRIGRTAAAWHATPRIYRSDEAGTRIDLLDNPPVVAGHAEFNDAYDTKRRATIDVRHPDDLQRRRDWLVIDLELTSDLGETVTIPLGHYIVEGKDVSMDNTGRVGSVSLRDHTYMLHIAGFAGDTRVLAGTDHGQAARDVLGLAGVPPNLIAIPDSGTAVGEDTRPLPNEVQLAFLTRLLRGGGMYQPWQAMDHRLTSRKSRDIRTSPADAVYHSADGAKIVPPVKEPASDLSGLYNQVTVHKQGFGDVPDITYTLTVSDESSPVHPERLGRPGAPLILPRYIPAYQLPESPAGEIVAILIAIGALSEGASLHQPLTIQTYPDHTLDAHQILDLDLIDPTDGTSHYTGSWWQRAWDIRLRGAMAVVKRDLFRTERWQ